LGREQIRAMSAAIDGASAGQRAALDTFVKHARGYVELLRQHITKEDHCLFPMADHRLSAEDQDALLASFAATERDDMGEGTHERYLALAQKLAERFHVAPRSVGIAHACCGHR
jgi:hemerythrin-like domain-containing protein